MHDLTRVNIELAGAGYGPAWGWDPPNGKSCYSVELCAFMLTAEHRKAPADEYFVFYNNTNSPDGALALDWFGYDQDNDLTRAVLSVDLSKVAPQIGEIVLTVFIPDAEFSFGYEPASLIRIYDPLTNAEIYRSRIGVEFSSDRGFDFGRLCRTASKWEFEPIGISFSCDLEALINKYGLQSAASQRQGVVAAFDFDSTITIKDTFLPFLRRAFGESRVRIEILRLIPEGFKMVIGLSTRDRIKEKIVSALFTGESCERLDAVAAAYIADVRPLLRPAALERIRWHKEQGHRCVMVSASLDLYLKPIALELGFDDLLCTNPERHSGLFSGELVSGNCRGAEKVRRLERLLGDLSAWEIHAYGDSTGDREMLAVAKNPHYRPFED